MDTNTFLMMGPPGSGKGTQAKLLAKRLGADIYSSGNRLREMGKGDGFVNQKIKAAIDSGELLPAWLSSHMFVEVLLGLSPSENIVFEGACRQLEEARAFVQSTEWLERPYSAIFLNISDTEVEKRLSLRRGVEGRSDDASDTVPHRIAEYKQNTIPVVEFFRSHGVLLEIDGEHSIDEVHQTILNTLRLS